MGTMAVCLDQNQNSIDCSDPNCTYGDCNAGSVAVTGGVPASTVPPNPSIYTPAAGGSSLSQLGSTMGQWGATIASIVSGQPTVSGPTGVRTGYAALPASAQPAGGMGIILVIGAVIVLLFLLKKE